MTAALVGPVACLLERRHRLRVVLGDHAEVAARKDRRLVGLQQVNLCALALYPDGPIGDRLRRRHLLEAEQAVEVSAIPDCSGRISSATCCSIADNLPPGGRVALENIAPTPRIPPVGVTATGADLLVGTAYAAAVRARLQGTVWHAPAHLDAEALSALGRLCRSGQLQPAEVDERLTLLASMPVRRQLLAPLLPGAWARRVDLRLVDALYVELAAQLQAPLITTDQRLARASALAEAVTT